MLDYTRLGFWLGTTAAVGLFALVAVSLVVAEYLLVTGALFVVLSVLLFALTDGTALVMASGVIAVFPVGYHVYHVLGSEATGDVATVRAFRAVFADLERVTPRDGDRAHLLECVGRLAAAADVPTPAVFVLETTTPITATVGYRPSSSALVLSSGVCEALEGRELEAVVAHELAHLGNRDAAVMTALAFPWTTGRVYRDRETTPALSVLTGIPSVAGRLCLPLVGRVGKFVADDWAVEITGDLGPDALASALETLEAELEATRTDDLSANPTLAAFSILPATEKRWQHFDPGWRRTLRGVLATHPPTEKRLERLRSASSDQAGTDRRSREIRTEEETTGLPATLEGKR